MFGRRDRQLLLELLRKVNLMADALTDLQNAVAAELTVEQSAITLLQQLAADVAAANAISPVAVEAVVANINANAAALAAAVTANTPAAPAPAPTPSP
jgi:hypothetical protein